MELIDYLFLFIKIEMLILKDLILENVAYPKALLKFITLSLIEKAFMTKQYFLI